MMISTCKSLLLVLFQKITVVDIRAGDFTVSVTLECIACIFQFFFQLIIVFDNTVVNQRGIAALMRMGIDFLHLRPLGGMGIDFARFTMCCPARVCDSHLTAG